MLEIIIVNILLRIKNERILIAIKVIPIIKNNPPIIVKSVVVVIAYIVNPTTMTAVKIKAIKTSIG